MVYAFCYKKGNVKTREINFCMSLCRCTCDRIGYLRLGDRCVTPAVEECTTTCPEGSECRGLRCYQKCKGDGASCPAGLSCINGLLTYYVITQFLLSKNC